MAQTLIRHGTASNRATNPETALTTELNSLANATASALGPAISNDASTECDLLVDIEVALASLNPTGTPYVELYICASIDNSNYADSPGEFLGAVPVTTGSGAKRAVLRDVPVPNRDFKIVAKNMTNVAFAASGSTVKLWFHGPASGA